MRLHALTIKHQAIDAMLAEGMLVPALVRQFLAFHGIEEAYRYAILSCGCVRIEPTDRCRPYTHNIVAKAGRLN